MKKLALALISALSFGAHAGVIVNNSAIGSIVNDFESQTAGDINDGFGGGALLFETGAIYGERFQGQTLTVVGGFDVLSGTPVSGLFLEASALAGDNIGILSYGSNVIYGDVGYGIGEGALSLVLDVGSDTFAFDVLGADGGGLLVAQFFALDGSLLGSISQAAANGHFGYQTTGGDMIWGVSITNNDNFGIAFDNVSFGAAVPEPGTMALLGLSLLGLGVTRRKSKQ